MVGTFGGRALTVEEYEAIQEYIRVEENMGLAMEFHFPEEKYPELLQIFSQDEADKFCEMFEPAYRLLVFHLHFLNISEASAVPLLKKIAKKLSELENLILDAAELPLFAQGSESPSILSIERAFDLVPVDINLRRGLSDVLKTPSLDLFVNLISVMSATANKAVERGTQNAATLPNGLGTHPVLARVMFELGMIFEELGLEITAGTKRPTASETEMGDESKQELDLLGETRDSRFIRCVWLTCELLPEPFKPRTKKGHLMTRSQVGNAAESFRVKFAERQKSNQN